MKKGIFIYFGYDMPIAKRFELIKNAGFDSVMVWWGDGDEDEIVSLAQENNLFICNAHLPFEEINLLWNSDESGDIYTDMLCGLIKKCGNKNIPTAVLHVSRGVATPPYNEIGLNRIRKILQVAQQSNVNIAFENLRYVHYLDYVFSNITSDKLKFCYDSGHHNCLSPERDLLSEFGDKLIALHLDDNMGDSDIHMLPYDGTSNWDIVTDKLAKLNYNGVISLEVQQDRHEMYADLQPEEFLKTALERAQRIENAILRKKAFNDENNT